MKTATAIGLVFATGLLGAAIPAATSVCGATARNIRFAAKHEARADYSLRLATCLNDTGANFNECAQQAQDDLDEALELADDQYEARLDVCGLLGGGAYDPETDGLGLSPNVNNSYLPFVLGRTLVYEAQTSDGFERVVVKALHETTVIDGILCRTVSDIVTLDGELIEDTLDWFAQGSNGDVWYFGEVAKNFEDGFLDNLDGSWRSGKNDAKPGILMLGNATIGAVYRQEFLVNEAEDLARVISLDETVVVPAGTFQHCLQTEEWTPIEPDVFERKFYAPGVGLVLSVHTDTGERLELTQILN